MRYATLLRRAWKLTRQNPRLIRLLVIPALAQVLFYSIRLAWQSYRYSTQFGFATEEYDLAGFYSIFEAILAKNLVWPFVLFVVFVLAFQYLLMPMVDGTVYFAVKQYYASPKSYISLRQKLLKSSGTFFELFVLRAVFSFFNPASALLWTASFYRYFVDSFWVAIRPFMIFYIVVSLLITFFTVYAPFYLLYNGESFKNSLRKSVGLAFVYIGQTSALFLLVILMNIRIFINFLILLGVPTALFFFFGTWGVLGSVFFWIMLVLLFLIISYLNAVLDVFITGLWARAFLAFSAQQEKNNEL